MKLFNKWAKSYDKPLFQFWMRRFHAPVLEELEFSNNNKILDCGCGTGELLLNLKDKAVLNGKNLFGIDFSENMLKEARKKLGKNVTLKKADAHDLPFPDNYFDFVISTEAFHHYYNQSIVLREMKRVVKKKGKVLIVDINFFLRPIHWLFEKFEPGCVKVNNRKEMKKLFQIAGLRKVKQRRNFIFSVMTRGSK